MEARIEHTRESCLRLALVQDKCFGRTRRVVRGVLGMIPIAVGLWVGLDRTRGVLLVVLGVMIFYYTSFLYEADAEKAYRLTPEAFRKVTYRFGEERFLVISGGKERETAYTELHALVTDGFYYYLFVNPEQAYMMKPEPDDPQTAQRFEEYLTERTGLRWRAVRTKEPFARVLLRRFRQRGEKE